MRMRRRKNDRVKWLLAALGPLLGGLAWWVSRTICQKQTAHHHETALVEIPEGRITAMVDPGALQVPVTAQKDGHRGAAQARDRSARVYDAPPALPPPSGDAVPERGRFPWILASALLLILVGFTVYSLLGSRPARPQVTVVPGGDVEAGRQAIQSWGCGSCHTIPGIPGAYGKVGPKLEQMAEQTYIAGMLPNNPDNLIRWITNPQEIQPGNAMPNTDVNYETAKHMAAYLYSIR